jgi:hypothetical protein
MVVPGVRLRKIVTPSVSLAITGLPDRLEVREKEPHTIQLVLQNIGNRPTTYSLTWQLTQTLKRVSYQEPWAARKPRLSCYFFASLQPSTHHPAHGGCHVSGRRRAAEVHAGAGCSYNHRTSQDVVEIDFGGLDRLDDL